MLYVGKLVSINEKYGKGRRGLYLTDGFRNFKESLIVSFMATATERGIDYPVNVAVTFIAPEKMDSDCTLKATFDALQGAGIICNDNQIVSFSVTRMYCKEKGAGSIMVSLEKTEKSPSFSLQEVILQCK